jgi:hypothetical protein
MQNPKKQPKNGCAHKPGQQQSKQIILGIIVESSWKRPVAHKFFGQLIDL